MAYSLRVGDVKISVIAESVAPLLKWQEIHPDATETAIRDAQSARNQKIFDSSTGKLVIAIQGFLLETKDRSIMIDTCVGDCKARARPEFDRAEFGWVQRLRTLGIDLGKVDTVVSTHLHVDHVGCNTYSLNGKWAPTFPNARYVFVEEEVAFWESELAGSPLERTGDYISDSIRPLFEQGVAEIVPPSYAISQEVRLLHLPGHTPGHVGVVVESNNERAILSGDLFHSALQCENPAWNTRFCVDPDVAQRSRRDFFEAHCGSNTVVIPAHFPFPCAGYIRRSGDTYAFEFLESTRISLLTEA
ncbi:MBL fold metallo-hydrolase [Paraburkholderia sp. MMS20-SJTR3]|uniref:MBL fold metallo-hydrolase n=1 Tax=Paraburkholderia sejongensis TaxID=2886946 RepID=A0ABS8JXZ4_9BURK|nr:MBL fold metallo-hydrolase [Paraburkholderia sp. MMS20-SJTR3]MCC8394765.1 MBL fold metallo-hydrolase [Paraburkholderia sp. MMS20-SJTR3]